MGVINSLFGGVRQGRTQPVITAPAAPYCMERISDTEAEISLYGDIVQRRPTDWSTGKPSEGQYIILSEFLKDLKAIEDVSKLTVRIHSAGGNAYDAITIHNRLKELPAEITVIVDGIAMSGGSLIMCAANKVKVNPASLVMIHKCWSFVWDAMNADELRKMAESNDAVDRAQAAIYHAKTGMSEADLLTLMGNETYMTGREAVDKGFADELIDGEAPDIAASADRRTIYYCGQPVWATPGRPLPASIQSPRVPAPAGPAAPAAPAQEADPAATERARIQAIDEIAPNILDKKLVEDAKYGHPCSAQELAFRAMKMRHRPGADPRRPCGGHRPGQPGGNRGPGQGRRCRLPENDGGVLI